MDIVQRTRSSFLDPAGYTAMILPGNHSALSIYLASTSMPTFRSRDESPPDPFLAGAEAPSGPPSVDVPAPTRVAPGAALDCGLPSLPTYSHVSDKPSHTVDISTALSPHSLEYNTSHHIIFADTHTHPHHLTLCVHCLSHSIIQCTTSLRCCQQDLCTHSAFTIPEAPV